jgi:hypothetical protein
MVASLRLDTLKYAKRLTGAGLSREAAEAIVEGLSEADLSELATRADVDELKAEIGGLRVELRSEIAAVRTELKHEIAQVRTDLKDEIAQVRTEFKDEITALRTELRDGMAQGRTALAELRADMYRQLWVLGIGIVGLTVGLTVALVKLLPG